MIDPGQSAAVHIHTSINFRNGIHAIRNAIRDPMSIRNDIRDPMSLEAIASHPVMGIVVDNLHAGALRATSREMKDAFDNHNTRLRIGSRDVAQHPPYLDELVRKVVAASPMLTHVSVVNYGATEENGWGAASMRILVPGLSAATRLHTLDLCGNKLGAAGAAALAPLLMALPGLTTLDIGANYIMDAGMAALQQPLGSLTRLRKLYMPGNGLSSEGAVALWSSLAALRGLQELDVEFNRIAGEVAIPLATLTALTRLNIGYAIVNDACAAALAAFLEAMPGLQLQALEMQSNHIGGVGMAVLAPSIAKLHRLRSFDISSSIDPGGLAALAPHLSKLTALRSLTMAAGIDIADAEGVRALSAMLSSLPTLTMLDIGFNPFGDDGAAALAPALAGLANLTSLDIVRIDIDMAGATALVPALRTLTGLQKLNIGLNSISFGEYEALNGMLPMLDAYAYMNWF